MFFAPFNRTLYNWIVPLPNWMRYCLTTMIIGCGILIWFFFIYTPLGDWLLTESVEVSHLHRRYHAMQELSCDLIPLKERVTLLQEQVASYYSDCKQDEQKSNEQIAYILNMLQEAHLQLKGYKSGNIRTKDWSDKWDIKVDCSGTLDQIRCFFSKMQLCDRMISIKDISIKRTDSHEFLGSLTISYTILKKKPLNLE